MTRNLIDRYCLVHDLAEPSEDQYRKIGGIFADWAGTRPLSAETLSEFLREKQRENCSCWYVRSLRSHLLAVLRFAGDVGRVRPVKCGALSADEWGPPEVNRLVEACAVLSSNRQQYWRTLIPAAWWTGFSGVDLHLIEREHVAANGELRFRRHKTGAEVLVWLPPDLVAHVEAGLIWPRPWSAEWERRVFRKICSAAGLTGTMKKLRRSSGVSAELLNPGHGHEHLGNTRSVFERHYLRRRIPLAWRPENL